jgi:hypothetical protein
VARPSNVRVFLSLLVKTRYSDGWAIARKQSCSGRDTDFRRMPFRQQVRLRPPRIFSECVSSNSRIYRSAQTSDWQFSVVRPVFNLRAVKLTAYVPRRDAFPFVTKFLGEVLPRRPQSGHSSHSLTHDDALSRNSHIACCGTQSQQLESILPRSSRFELSNTKN